MLAGNLPVTWTCLNIDEKMESLWKITGENLPFKKLIFSNYSSFITYIK